MGLGGGRRVECGVCVWGGGVVVISIRGTLDLLVFNVMLGSFNGLISKYWDHSMHLSQMAHNSNTDGCRAKE